MFNLVRCWDMKLVYCINDHSYDMFIVAAVGLLVVLFGKAVGVFNYTIS